MSRIVLDEVKDFNLEHIFDCGQCFRWNAEDDGSYTGVAGGRAVNVALSGKSLVIDNATSDDFEEFWRDYFDMDTDYGKIKDTLRAQDPVIGKAIDEGEGIRLLDQEIWETIISFIIFISTVMSDKAALLKISHSSLSLDIRLAFLS